MSDSPKYKAFISELNALCEKHQVVLEIRPAPGGSLVVRDLTRFDFDVGAAPTYLASPVDETGEVEVEAVPDTFVNCGLCHRVHPVTTVKPVDIEESFEGHDVLTYECPVTHEITKATAYRHR